MVLPGVSGHLGSGLCVVLFCALIKGGSVYGCVHAYVNMARTLTEVGTRARAPEHTKRNETSTR